ncbi:MAG: hypothetical protein KDA78_05750, partial [Planctomycetaceae bacterium]|nr:hypothetical protein [Planctomycetaceae bacterium]
MSIPLPAGLVGITRWFACLTCSLALAGCSSEDGPQVYTTTGQVTWQGNPLESGRIIFVQKGSDSRTFSAPIEKGDFRIKTQGGPMRVEIRASRPTTEKSKEVNPPPPGETAAPELTGEMFI